MRLPCATSRSMFVNAVNLEQNNFYAGKESVGIPAPPPPHLFYYNAEFYKLHILSIGNEKYL